MLSKVRSTNSVDPFRVLQQACEVIHPLSGERAIGPSASAPAKYAAGVACCTPWHSKQESSDLTVEQVGG